MDGQTEREGDREEDGWIVRRWMHEWMDGWMDRKIER
jgi:hypothetical protein